MHAFDLNLCSNDEDILNSFSGEALNKGLKH